MHKFIFLLLSFSYATSFYFFVDQTPLCVGIERPSETLNFAYDVSSVNPQNTQVQILNQDGQLLRQYHGRKNWTTIQSDQPFHICFSTIDNTQKSISWDVWQDSTTQIKKLASKSDISKVHTTLMEASSILRVVAQQQKFQQQREHMHVGIISETQNVVKFYGVIKVMIIIGLVVAQIMILKYSLNKKQSQTFM